MLLMHAAGALFALWLLSRSLCVLMQCPDEVHFKKGIMRARAVFGRTTPHAHLARARRGWSCWRSTHTSLGVTEHGDDHTIVLLESALALQRWGTCTSVLELGCGNGARSLQLAVRDAGGDYIAVDADADNVQSARSQRGRVHFMHGSPCAVLSACAPEELHAVFAVDALGSGLPLDALDRLFSAAQSALLDSGRLVLVDWFRAPDMRQVAPSVRHATLLSAAEKTALVRPARHELQVLARRHGLHLVQQKSLTRAAIPACWRAWQRVHFLLHFAPVLRALCWLHPPLKHACRAAVARLATAHAVRGGGLTYNLLVFECLHQ